MRKWQNLSDHLYFFNYYFFRVVEKIFYPFNLFLALVFVFIIRIVSPILIIRWSRLSTARIGVCVEELDIYCNAKKSKIGMPTKPFVDIFYLARAVCNKQMAKMLKRNLFCLPSMFMHQVDNVNVFCERFFPSNNLHEIGLENYSRDKNNFFEKYQNSSIPFTKKEIIKGNKLLKEMGISNNEKYVCLAVRDSKYLSFYYPNVDYSEHNHRNFEIEKFNDAITNLANKGYYVLRMGKKVSSKLNLQNPKVIDYANSKFRSDFMDFFLMANCFFCISTVTGIDSVAMIFRRPILEISVSFYEIRTYSKNFMALPKVFYSNKLKRNLTYREIIDYKLYQVYKSADFKSRNIQPKQTDSDEIKRACDDMIEYLTNENEYIKKNNLVFDKFWGIFSKQNKESYNKNHGLIKSTLSKTFLNNNTNLLK